MAFRNIPIYEAADKHARDMADKTPNATRGIIHDFLAGFGYCLHRIDDLGPRIDSDTNAFARNVIIQTHDWIKARDRPVFVISNSVNNRIWSAIELAHKKYKMPKSNLYGYFDAVGMFFNRYALKAYQLENTGNVNDGLKRCMPAINRVKAMVDLDADLDNTYWTVEQKNEAAADLMELGKKKAPDCNIAPLARARARARVPEPKRGRHV